jgi:ABC-2 type transport system ATP-binding protein
MAEEPTFYDELSAFEYLSFLAALRALDPAESSREARRLLDRLGLADRAGEPVERYSHGMRKKLSFAAAALHHPRALLCDEAIEGFDLEASIAARAELRALASGGTAVLFTSHVAAELERLCDVVVVLHRGRIVRTLARAEWGGSSPEPSVLERAFLDAVHSLPASEPA